jgi:hypothetical protein
MNLSGDLEKDYQIIPPAFGGRVVRNVLPLEPLSILKGNASISQDILELRPGESSGVRMEGWL